jgi:GTP-binding protein YchF
MLRTAIVGYPLVGKTTLFQLMTSARETRSGAKADAHVGVARVPDQRLDALTALYQPGKRVPALVEFADSVLGQNTPQALVDVTAFRNADALLHVVRLFRDPAIPNARDSIDPRRDVRSMEDELILADLGVAERRVERLVRDLKKTSSADLQREHALITRCKDALERGEPVRSLDLSREDARLLKGFQFLSGKPLLIVWNIDEADIGQAHESAAPGSVETIHGAAKDVSVCAKIELEIAELDTADASAFLSDLGLRESGLDRVISAAYDLLGYISFFTVGEDECRAWSIPRGTVAQAAAGEIHSDIARGFIRAEVVAYEHLIARGSLAACREHAEVRLEGKEYVVRDGDVINFRFAT